jgi:hypothetical protein
MFGAHDHLGDQAAGFLDVAPAQQLSKLDL